MPTAKVLSKQQIDYVNQGVAEVFAEDVKGQITFDVKNFIIQAKQVIQSMKLEETFHSKDNKHKGWKLASLTTRNQALALKGYLLIFKFREYLLNESIDYRYYYTDKNGKSRVVEFTDQTIGNYIKFSPAGIQLKTSKLTVNEVLSVWEYYINRYFKLLTVPNPNIYFQKKDSYGQYRVTKRVADSYPLQSHYPAFNKGHIYEAIDTTFSHVLEKDNGALSNQQAVLNYIFGRYLVRDSIKGSRGADNNITSTSIKSHGADLYDFYTIKDQLEQIVQILENNPTNGTQEISDFIYKNFLHSSKFNHEDEMQKTAEEAMEKLIAEIEKYNKKN